MLQTPFHAYYSAMKLSHLQDEDKLLPVYSENTISVYPYQVAAALFAMRSPYQSGVILCDEAGMGKTHEALLVLSQCYYEGKRRIMVVIPNMELLMQWAEIIDNKYSIPFTIMQNENTKSINDFNGVVLTTYDYLAQNIDKADKTNWDIIVFEEANVLSPVYLTDGGKQAKLLKEFSKDAFKILLTGTPIEKNIMDLYGLISFIDDRILPDPDTYMKRYLRRPENYPELAQTVSKYCFRTLRSQAKQYAKIPDRCHITLEYVPSDKERRLYNMMFEYINKPKRYAFPQMEQYELALMLLGILSSSTAAAKSTIKNIIKRLKRTNNADDELAEFELMLRTAEEIVFDKKIELLLLALQKLFPVLKKLGANKKAIIFTESIETQSYLYSYLNGKYNVYVYNGRSGSGYNVIKQFKKNGEVLISTDNGAKGFNLEECSLVINYDLLYNTLKMEQRIDRIHRINQKNDCIVLSFINKENFADVRKLELVSKRHILSDGVFGVSDSVIGRFSSDLEQAIRSLTARTSSQIEKDYQRTLSENLTENTQTIEAAEDILFTTFTKELSDKIKITPQYAEERAKEINNELWELTRYFFEDRNKTETDCRFEIDDEKHIISARDYSTLPPLFYYPSGNRNVAYRSLKQYKKYSLLSPLSKGIFFNTACSDSGTMYSGCEDCVIALYLIKIYAGRKEIKSYPVLVGKMNNGRILSHSECEDILNAPVSSYEERGSRTAYWLKSPKYSDMDRLIDLDEYIRKEQKELTPLQREEIDRMKLNAVNQKNELSHSLDSLDLQIKELNKALAEVKSDRLKLLTIQRQISVLNIEKSAQKEKLFFKEMQIDLDLEKQINEFLGREKLTAKAVRQFLHRNNKQKLMNKKK